MDAWAVELGHAGGLLHRYTQWQDEQERRTLLASFAQPRAVNPEAYDQRLRFWRTVILDAVRHGLFMDLHHSQEQRHPSVFWAPTAEEMAARFAMRSGARPLGLAHVLHCMIEEKLAVSCSSSGFLAKSDRLGWDGGDDEESLLYRLARLVITTPITAGWRWISGSAGGGGGVIQSSDGSNNEWESGFVEDGGFIVPEHHGAVLFVALVEECCKAIQEHHVERGDGSVGGKGVIMTWAEFISYVNVVRKEKQWIGMHHVHDFDLVLRSLERSRFCSVMRSGNWEMDRTGWLVRLGSDLKITEEEANMATLKTVKERLERSVYELAQLANSYRLKAQTALRDGDKSLALFELRRSKVTEKTRQCRMAALTNINGIVEGIDAAQTDAAVFDAYRSGQRALQQTVQRSGLTLDRIDDVIVSLNEMLVDQSDVSRTLAAEFSSPTSSLDEQALEMELDRLMEEADASPIISKPGATLVEIPSNMASIDNDGSLSSRLETSNISQSMSSQRRVVSVMNGRDLLMRAGNPVDVSQLLPMAPQNDPMDQLPDHAEDGEDLSDEEMQRIPISE